MSRLLITKLSDEATSLLEELRGSPLFRRYEAVRRLLDLYDAPSPIGADLDALMGEAPVAVPQAQDLRQILERLGSEMRSSEMRSVVA